MKKQKSILIALPLILAMLFVSLAPYAVVPAKAYDSVTDTIYYFSDYYPTLDKATLEQEFPDYQVVYHHQWVTEATLFSAIMQGFPSGANVHTVIIDIKSFVPSGAVLSAIFSYFKTMGYRTVFVTPYDRGQFDSQSFWNYVDRECHSNLTILKSFVKWSLNNMFLLNGETLSDTTILIDGRLIDPLYGDSSALVERFHFYKVLLGKKDDPDYNTPTNIRMLVHWGDNSFYEVTPDSVGTPYVAADKTDLVDENGDCIWEHICAIGFWELEDDFYQYVIDNQSSIDEFPLFVLPVDPPTYGEGGVAAFVFTMEDARAIAEEDAEEETWEPFEADVLLGILSSLLT